MVSPRRGSILALLMLLSLLGGAGAARADEGRELQAKEACLGGHPDKGIELLAQLYAETNDPTYIYNQGRCFEQNGRPADAVTRTPATSYTRDLIAAIPGPKDSQ